MQTFACGGFISAAIQFLLIAFPSVAPNFQGVSPIIIIVAISLFFGLAASWPRPIEMEYSAPKTKIRIIKGDLLDQDGHLVIGVCDTFDTETPNIISRGSLLGQTLDKLYGGDTKELDRLLNQELTGKNPVGQVIKDGKNNKYEIGTVAVVRHDPRLIFFWPTAK